MPHFRFVAPHASPFRACGPAACGPASSSGAVPFNPLLDLLQAFESEFAEPQKPQQPKKKTIVPHFDVLETSTSYVLEGELPGVANRTSLNIQFKDAQTLIVKGEVSRPNHDEVTEEAIPVTASPVAAAERPASPTPTEKSLKPTVEETVDESESGSEHDEFEVVDTPSTDKATEPVAEDPPVEAPTTRTKTIKAKYWVNERAIGVFERSFSFQGLVDQDGVKATLTDGILTIVVPKREPYVRRVQIQ